MELQQFTPEMDKKILEIPLQVWIMSIKHELDSAKNPGDILSALTGGARVVARKMELEEKAGSKPLNTAIKISV